MTKTSRNGFAIKPDSNYEPLDKKERMMVLFSDIIEFLNQCDPNDEVVLDKDVWVHGDNTQEVIKNTWIFSKGSGNYIVINN